MASRLLQYHSGGGHYLTISSLPVRPQWSVIAGHGPVDWPNYTISSKLVDTFLVHEVEDRREFVTNSQCSMKAFLLPADSCWKFLHQQNITE